MSRKKKIIIGILCAVLMPIAIAGIVKVNFDLTIDLGARALIAYWTATSPDPVVYELTDEEKEWLKVKFGDEERIEEGRLYESEEKQLKMAREGLSVLEEKYPGYHFRIAWLDRFDTWTSFTMYEETTGKRVVMNVEEDEESGYEITDNFYGYFFENKYEAYMLELFEERGLEDISMWVGLSSLAGKEHDINMTVEDVVGGRLELWPSVHIDVYVGDMSEEECVKCAQTLQSMIEDFNLDGAYFIDFMNVTKEEMLYTGDSGEIIYEHDFQSHRREENE